MSRWTKQAPVSTWDKRSKRDKQKYLEAQIALYGTPQAKELLKATQESSPKPPEKPKKRRGRPPKAKKAKARGKSKKPDDGVPLERDEQRQVVVYADKRKIPYYAVPNAARRTMWEALQAKRDGMKAGVPDLVFPVARMGFNGLYIEMKRQSGGVVSPKQQFWIKVLALMGYQVMVCAGASEAIAYLEKYFDGWVAPPELMDYYSELDAFKVKEAEKYKAKRAKAKAKEASE